MATKMLLTPILIATFSYLVLGIIIVAVLSTRFSNQSVSQTINSLPDAQVKKSPPKTIPKPQPKVKPDTKSNSAYVNPNPVKRPNRGSA